MTGRLARICLIVSLIAAFLFIPSAQAQTSTQIILKLGPLANLLSITSLLHGTVIDSVPEANTYLLSVPSLPLLNGVFSLLGVQWIEPNTSMKLPVNLPALLHLPGTASPDWYRAQPALQLIRAGGASPYATGQGVTVADINSNLDFAHPALIGHLTGGYDFVTNRATGSAAIQNQASAGFLDEDPDAALLNQASAGFLDGDDAAVLTQASAGFLDGTTQAFLTQASAGFLDTGSLGLFQASAGFLDNGKNPAYSHGTLCAGLIAVVAPRAAIMPLRAFDDDGNTDLFTLVKAVRYATTHGAEVINMSFGTLTNSKALKEAIDAAAKANVILVASAGNNNTSAAQYPASYSNVIGVAATDLWDKKGSFSNYGAMVKVDAPGVNVISASPNNGYSVVNGTSFSAPIVAGAAALVRSLKATGVTTAIFAGTVKIDAKNPGYYSQLGYGRIDVTRAVHP